MNPPSKGAVYFGLLLLTIIAFGQSLFNDYAYDGTSLIHRLYDPVMIPLSDLFSERYRFSTGAMSWRPVGSFTMLMIDARLFAANPALSHAFNMMLHAFNGFLVYTLLQCFRKETWKTSLFAAALFTAHPLVSEVALCVGFRFDLLGLTGILGSLLCFLHAPWPKDRRSSFVWALGFVALAFGFLSKEIGIIAGPLIVVLLSIRTRKAAPPLLFSVIALIILSVIMVFWLRFKDPNYTETFLGGGGRFLGMANFLVVSVEIYLSKLIFPWPLRIGYDDFVPVVSLGAMRFLTAFFIILVLVSSLLVAGKKDALIWLGLFWIALGLAPVSQIVPIPDPIAERFLYVPMVGVALIAKALLDLLSMPTLDRRPYLLLLPILLLAGISHVRSLDWRDDLTLNIANWEASPEVTPLVSLNLGALKFSKATQMGDGEGASLTRDQAQAHLESIDQDSEHYGEAARLLAIIHLQRGEREQALTYYLVAKERLPLNENLILLGRLFDQGTARRTEQNEEK